MTTEDPKTPALDFPSSGAGLDGGAVQSPRPPAPGGLPSPRGALQASSPAGSGRAAHPVPGNPPNRGTGCAPSSPAGGFEGMPSAGSSSRPPCDDPSRGGWAGGGGPGGRFTGALAGAPPQDPAPGGYGAGSGKVEPLMPRLAPSRTAPGAAGIAPGAGAAALEVPPESAAAPEAPSPSPLTEPDPREARGGEGQPSPLARPAARGQGGPGEHPAGGAPGTPPETPAGGGHAASPPAGQQDDEQKRAGQRTAWQQADAAHKAALRNRRGQWPPAASTVPGRPKAGMTRIMPEKPAGGEP